MRKNKKYYMRRKNYISPSSKKCEKCDNEVYESRQKLCFYCQHEEKELNAKLEFRKTITNLESAADALFDLTKRIVELEEEVKQKQDKNYD